MKKNKRGFLIIALIVLWALGVSLARTLLAPAVGAATVAQMNSSDGDFFSALNFISAASLASIGITGVFFVLLYLVLRAK